MKTKFRIIRHNKFQLSRNRKTYLKSKNGNKKSKSKIKINSKSKPKSQKSIKKKNVK